jgi:hypothetical protein
MLEVRGINTIREVMTAVAWSVDKAQPVDAARRLLRQHKLRFAFSFQVHLPM